MSSTNLCFFLSLHTPLVLAWFLLNRISSHSPSLAWSLLPRASSHICHPLHLLAISSHFPAWSLLDHTLQFIHSPSLSTPILHPAWSPELFPCRENQPPPKRLFVYFISLSSLVPFESSLTFLAIFSHFLTWSLLNRALHFFHPPSLSTSSLVPFEFFQMFKTFFGYEICLFRFVGCFHVQHTYIPFLHRWIQVVYPKMTTTI